MANKIINDGRIEQVYPVASGDSEGRNGPFTWHRYDVKVNGVKYACFKGDIAATFKEGVVMSFSYSTKMNGEFENHTILEIFKASNWDENGVLRVEAEDMSDVWDTGAPPTEEAKRDVVGSQFMDSKPQQSYGWTNNKDEQIRWAQSVNLGAEIVAAFIEHAETPSELPTLEFIEGYANHFYPLLERGPQPPDSPVEPQQAQTEAEPFALTPTFNWPRFWATCKDKLGLNDDAVHKILGMDSAVAYIRENNIENAKQLFEKVENLHTAATVFGPPDDEPEEERLAENDPIEPVSAVDREEVALGRGLTDQEKKYTFKDSTWLAFTSGVMDDYSIDTQELALVFVKGFTGDVDPVTYCRERLVNLSELKTRVKKSNDDKPEWLEEIHSRQAEQAEQS